ncbi:MAG: lamin tail domain-containing protein, partial [Planctomycetota bacterium]
GGEISFGDVLSIDATQGEIFYTLDGSDPRAEGGDAVGTLFQPGSSVSLLESTTVKARVRNGSTWSALTSADFVVVPVDGSIFVTEVNYHPQDPTDAEIDVIPNLDDDDFEFVEISNLHPQATVNLLGMQFVDGIEFTFPNVSMAPGDRGVIVRNTAAFQIRYGTNVNILGQYSGGLANGGEQLELVDALGNQLLNMEYGDDDLWPESTDGVGATLVWNGDVNDDTSLAAGKHFSWTHSAELWGTPGESPSAKPQIVINEVVSNASANGVDSIELYNAGTTPVDISGWNLSDTSDDLFRFEIPSGTTIGAGDFLVFDETQFGFGLNGSEGDDVWLTIPDGTRTVQFVDEVHFGAAFEEFSFGRVPDGVGRLTTTSRNTLGCSNRTAHPSDVVISEINYSPDEPNAFALALEPTMSSFDLEFVEITNNGLSNLNLTNWQLSGGIDYEFAAGTSLAAGEALVVVSFDVADTTRLAAFRAQYGISPTARIVGGFSGRLNNAGEAVRLERPDVPVAGLIPRVVVDEVIYDDLPPWAGVDANGFSLQRNSAIRSGNEAAIWFASLPTAGIATFLNSAPGEFNGDTTVDIDDINLLYDAIARGSTASNFDLDGNGVVDSADGMFMITQIIGTLPGDANLDMTVDVSDFNIWNSNKFGSCSGGWGAGDFNGDGVTDVSDFNIWNSNKFQSALRPAAESDSHFEESTTSARSNNGLPTSGFTPPTFSFDWLTNQRDNSDEKDRIDRVFSDEGTDSQDG